LHFYLKVFMLTCWGMLISGCGTIAPATIPPQLNYTPGPSVIVTDDSYDAGIFFARYPFGWRVITPAAFSTPWVVFTTRDETALIVLALDRGDTQVPPPPNIPADQLCREEQSVPMKDADTLTAALVAPCAEWDSYITIF